MEKAFSNTIEIQSTFSVSILYLETEQIDEHDVSLGLITLHWPEATIVKFTKLGARKLCLSKQDSYELEKELHVTSICELNAKQSQLSLKIIKMQKWHKQA